MTGPGQHASTPIRLSGWVVGALAVGLVSLGLPWGAGGAPGYLTEVRVPVIAAGIAVTLGWRSRSPALVRVGMALGLFAVLLAHLVGGGALALAFALVLVELALRRTTALTLSAAGLLRRERGSTPSV